ncbi:MAG TPA: amino acid ABC transporter permease [Candidatus Limnocylindria bacterium]|nr:amino acid ABC transporter permease [Candidatus Limnocylindria bacterium]
MIESRVEDRPRRYDIEDVERAEQRARWSWRAIFAVVWIGLVLGLGIGLALTGRIDPGFIAEVGPFILEGTPITLLVCVVSISLAIILATLGALGRLSNNPVLNAIASFYVSLIRGTPLIVQILFWYLALPQFGIVLDALPAGIGALAFNYGAYMTEIFRAGVEAVPPGQREAARALGMTEAQVMRRIVFPQALRIVTPAIGNEFIAMIKDSALVYILGVREVLWRADVTGTRFFRSTETLLIAAVVYWVLTIALSFAQERLERRLRRGER